MTFWGGYETPTLFLLADARPYWLVRFGSVYYSGATMKICCKCGERKQNTYFDINISCVGGFTSVCKKCRYERSVELKKSRAEFDVQFWLDKWGVANHERL